MFRVPRYALVDFTTASDMLACLRARYCSSLVRRNHAVPCQDGLDGI
jgi:hypothetical protein